MTNAEFHEWLSAEFAKYDLLNLDWKRKHYSVNELVYVLRMSGRDMCLNSINPETGGLEVTPSVIETFIPTRWLARYVTKLEYEEFEDDGNVYPLLNVECE